MARRRRAIASAAALAVLAAGCDPAPPLTARPALYRVTDADTVIWLIGTVHVLPPKVAWETATILAAERDADTLVTELPALAPGDAAQAFAAMARAPDLPPILERVPTAARAPLARLAKRAGLSLDSLSAMKSWAAALTLSAAAARIDGGASPANGVESVIEARMAGRKRIGLETLPEQLGFFDALDERDQRRLLTSSVTSGASFRQVLDAWAAGDEARLAELVSGPLRAAPALEAALLTRRNARWTVWIAQRMARPGRVLVAVGAGHLAGPKSVVATLRARGLRVQRIQ